MDKRVSFHSEFPLEALTKEPLTSLSLSLSSLNLLKLQAEIAQFKNLEKLSLNKNRLSGLPIEIGLLVNLKYLNLRGNWIREIPEILLQLKGLEVLDLSKNKIKQLPEKGMGDLIHLRVLSLSQNRIQFLPKYVADMNDLRILKIDDNPLEWPPMELFTQKESAEDESENQEVWLNTLKAFLKLNDPPTNSSQNITETTDLSPFPARTSSPAPKSSLGNHVAGNTQELEGTIKLSSTNQFSKMAKPESISSQNCHQLLHSFLATYQSQLEPLTVKYPNLDPYVTILYASVELYRVCGYLCDIVQKAYKQEPNFNPESSRTEISKLNLGALSLLKLLKEFLSCNVLEMSQILHLKSHMINLASEATITVKTIISDAVVLISPPNRSLDVRILAGMMTDWVKINESLQEALSQISVSPVPKLNRKVSQRETDIQSTLVAPEEQFLKMHETLIELSNLRIDSSLKQLVLTALQYCINHESLKLLDILMELLFYVKDDQKVEINQVAADLAAEAQELLIMLQEA